MTMGGMGVDWPACVEVGIRDDVDTAVEAEEGAFASADSRWLDSGRKRVFELGFMLVAGLCPWPDPVETTEILARVTGDASLIAGMGFGIESPGGT